MIYFELLAEYSFSSTPEEQQWLEDMDLRTSGSMFTSYYAMQSPTPIAIRQDWNW